MIKRIRLFTDFKIDSYSSANLSVSPPIDGPFLPTWFSIPDEMAQHFLVTDVKIGKNLQTISTGCLPASLFAESMSRRLDLDKIGLNMEHMVPSGPHDSRGTLILSLTNASDELQEITIDVIGLETGSKPANVDFKHSLGFGSTSVAGNSSANLHVQPQVDFSPSHLLIPNHVLDDFLVTSLWTTLRDKDAPNPRSSAMPDSLRDKNLRYAGLVSLSPRPMVTQGQFLILEVTNRSSRAKNFSGAVLSSLIS
jgi:hypothetical protein